MAYRKYKPADALGRLFLILFCVLFVVFTACSFTPAKAASYVYVGGFSHHFSDGDHNETHDYFGLRVDGYTVGTFNNSYNQRTYLATYYVKALEWNYIELGTQLGITYGYTKCYGHVPGESAKVCGLAIPEFTYKRFRWQPSVGVTHKVLTLTFRRPL